MAPHGWQAVAIDIAVGRLWKQAWQVLQVKYDELEWEETEVAVLGKYAERVKAALAALQAMPRTSRHVIKTMLDNKLRLDKKEGRL